MKKITFRYARTADRGASEPISGYEFDLGGIRLVVHKMYREKGWCLSEYVTGLSVGMVDKTRKAVQERAERHFLIDHPDHFQMMIRQINSNQKINF